MGGKFGKNQTATSSNKTGEQANGVTTNNYFSRLITNENVKQTKKNREKTSSVRTLNKSTSTDGGVISSASTIKHLVGHTGGYSMHDNLSHNAFTGHINDIYSSETTSQDVLEFRDACFRRGLISVEFHTVQQSLSNVEDQLQATATPDAQQELMNEPAVVPVIDIDQAPYEQDQADSSITARSYTSDCPEVTD